MTTERILSAAAELARARGYQAVTISATARLTGLSHPTVYYHYSGINDLRTAIMRQAIADDDIAIIAQGLACRDVTAVSCASTTQRKRAGAYVRTAL